MLLNGAMQMHDTEEPQSCVIPCPPLFPEDSALKNSALAHLDLLFQLHPCLHPCRDAVLEAAEAMALCFSTSCKLLICGNGGSAADSKHVVAELMKGFRLERRIGDGLARALRETSPEHGGFLAGRLQAGLPAVSLASEDALMTAVANDIDPALVFAQQVMALGRAGDVLLALSTSGNSVNVLYAVIVAKAKGMKTVLLSGRDGGRMRRHCDVAVLVPENECHLVQELHLPVYHALCLALEEVFFGDRP